MNCRVYGMQAKWRRIMLGITVGEIAESTGGKIIFGNKNDKIESMGLKNGFCPARQKPFAIFAERVCKSVI